MSTGPRRKTILIVDDDDSVTQYVADKVHAETVLTSITATTLHHARSLIEDKNVEIDAVLTDVSFAKETSNEPTQLLDGLDLLDLAHRQRPEVKLYVLSVWTERDNLRQRARELGIPVLAWFHKMYYPAGAGEDVPWKVIEKDLLDNPELESHDAGNRQERRESMNESVPCGDEVYLFDVFLAHNSRDKDQVRDIANELKRRGLKPWLDEWNVPPGRPFQDAIEEALPISRSIAVFIGPEGLGAWQSLELRVAISQFVDRNAPVIPVILKTADATPPLPPFLMEFNRVTFSSSIPKQESIRRLVWGITQSMPLNSEP